MDTGMVVAFAVFFFTAVGVYVVLEFRGYGKMQEATAKVLRLQVEIVAAQKNVVGFTKYADYLAAAKQAAADQMKQLAVKVVREGVHLETLQEETSGPPSDATVFIKYAVDYSFGFDAQPDSFELLAAPGGIELKISKPTLKSTSSPRPVSHGAPSTAELTDGHVAVIRKLPAISHRQGAAIALDAATLAWCEKKLLDFLYNFLAQQPGVKLVPAIKVIYR